MKNYSFKIKPKEYLKEQQAEQGLKDLKEEIELIKNQKSKPKSTKSVEITMSIQLLIFHYLGFLDQINLKTNIEKSILLASIFKIDNPENLRKALSNIGGKESELLTKNNLKYVHDLFDKIGYFEPLEKVKEDIKKLDFTK